MKDFGMSKQLKEDPDDQRNMSAGGRRELDGEARLESAELCWPWNKI